MHKIAILGATPVIVASSTLAQSTTFDPAPIDQQAAVDGQRRHR